MYIRPLPSRCARHPPPERGWAGNMEERTALLSLASHRLRGEGDHEVVEGEASNVGRCPPSGL